MRVIGKGSKQIVKNKITKIDPLKRMWIFGTVILIFSIFAEPRLIPAIFVFMLFLTFAQYKTKKRNTIQYIEFLDNEMKEKEAQLAVVYEHLESGNATLDEKLIQRELEEELAEMEIEMEAQGQTLDKIKAIEEKFKYFLAKFKKPSKMITAGKKEEKKD